MKQKAYEVNFDGIVGPTHNYSGLSYGNIASEKNRFHCSNPQEAALQGLEKMKFLADKGIKQAVLPPQERPLIPILRKLGFSGNDYKILKNVYTQSPELLLAVSSAACMWTANAATISPSWDSQDKLLHITPANLIDKFHRYIEADATSTVFKAIFKNPKYFIHHNPLPGSYFTDEGAANHTRFCPSHEKSGLQLFVFGRYAFQATPNSPKLYPARQAQEASNAISRLHALDVQNVLFIQQNPEAIDAGAFHNDVVSVGNENVFFFHEQAFLNKDKFLKELQEKYTKINYEKLICLEVQATDISLKEAVSSYLFNSQLITMPNGSMALIAPSECQENSNIKAYIDSLVNSVENPINEVHYMNLRQSMQNGGGPACLRLRVVMTPEELSATHQGIFLTNDLYTKLKNWIIEHYRDRLEINDLADPALLDEGRYALEELSKILNFRKIG